MDSIKIIFSVDYFNERDLALVSESDLSSLLYGIQILLLDSLSELITWFIEEVRLAEYRINSNDVYQLAESCIYEFIVYLISGDMNSEENSHRVLELFGVLIDDIVQDIDLLNELEYNTLINMMIGIINKVFHMVLNKVELVGVRYTAQTEIKPCCSSILVSVLFMLRQSRSIECSEV